MPKLRHPVIAALLLVACGSDPSGTAPPTRSYHMGFSAFPPRPDTTLVRLVAYDPFPLLVLEGGWPSVTVGPVVSSPELQSRYIRRHAAILDRTEAAAVFQITFTDLDLAASPLPPSSVLPLFAHLGMVDSALGPKPALAVWDSLLALDRRGSTTR